MNALMNKMAMTSELSIVNGIYTSVLTRTGTKTCYVSMGSRWAQVNGRNAISWEEKFKLDVWYVDNRSFWLDIKVICLTLKKVIVRVAISADGEATMSKFTGTS